MASRCRYSTAVTFWITLSASVTADGMSRRSALPVWQKACVLPCITARRFTLNAIFWPRHLSRIRGFHSRISAALCWTFWCSVMRFWKSVTALPVRSSDWKPHRQNIPAVAWRRMFTGGCRPSTSRQPSRPAPCFTCWSRILIRSCTACRNISAPLTLPG
ncbi:hypothetical protein EC142370_04756 [Escherichia coli O145:H34]|nr:hypothetical protein EC142370_04756 [Escherichia coli O145:H34]